MLSNPLSQILSLPVTVSVELVDLRVGLGPYPPFQGSESLLLDCYNYTLSDGDGGHNYQKDQNTVPSTPPRPRHTRRGAP